LVSFLCNYEFQLQKYIKRLNIFLKRELFYPGIDKALQKQIRNFWIGFKGIVIIQNVASNKRYLIGESCNLAHIETIETTCGEETDKDKGHKFGFLCKQGSPMAFYEGVLLMDPNPPII